MSDRRPVIPQDMKAFNRAIVQEWRANAGRLSGPMAGRNLILLTTTGASSGQPRTIVVGFGRNGDNLVAIASNNGARSEEHTSELQSRLHLVCRLLLEKKKQI